ncbi:hypothetical protein M0Q50_03800 [bacterium]|jgi:hypothetical protein|nr:hypothetical protein [bacterium]
MTYKEMCDSLYPKISGNKSKIIITSTPKGTNNWLQDYWFPSFDTQESPSLFDIIKEKNDIRKKKLDSL